MSATVRAWAPGRVNLIGEHTDYTGGLVLPMAIHLGTAVEGERSPGRVELRSDAEPEPVAFDLPVDARVAARVQPTWGRHVAGVAAELGATVGVIGTVTTTVPLGSGLSSSAALEVATALALGATGSPAEVAAACQRGSQIGTGVPCGIMDQLASAAGVEGHALRIDCRTLEVRPVPFPDDLDVVVVHSGQHRELAGSAYAARRIQCEAAEAVIGPLRDATAEDLDRIEDPLVRARARHVISENGRVDEFAAALVAGDDAELGRILAAGHASLRDDFDVSTPLVDALVDHLAATPGVTGARITGAGFGGCVVALCRPGVDPTPPGHRSWRVRPGPGAHLR